MVRLLVFADNMLEDRENCRIVKLPEKCVTIKLMAWPMTVLRHWHSMYLQEYSGGRCGSKSKKYFSYGNPHQDSAEDRQDLLSQPTDVRKGQCLLPLMEGASDGRGRRVTQKPISN